MLLGLLDLPAGGSGARPPSSFTSFGKKPTVRLSDGPGGGIGSYCFCTPYTYYFHCYITAATLLLVLIRWLHGQLSNLVLFSSKTLCTYP